MARLQIKALVYVEVILLVIDDIWGLSESALLLIEDELEDLLKEEKQ